MPNFDPRTSWQAVVALARRQHGVITARQLYTRGLAPRTVSHYAAIGWLHRIHHGVYALAPAPLLRPCGRRLAAVLVCGPGAALSHKAAADLHGLLPYTGARIDITVSSRGGRARPNLQIHRCATLRPQDTTAIQNIPTTTVARTLLDLAQTLPRVTLVRALDRAMTLSLFDLSALEEQLTHNHARKAAAARLNKALANYRPRAAPTWNQLEERFLALVSAADLPEPEIQTYLDLHDGEPMIQPDFLWREEKLIVELDGWGFHGGRAQFERDRRRDQRAAAAGFRTVRVTWDQLSGEPARLISTLRSAAASSAWAA